MRGAIARLASESPAAAAAALATAIAVWDTASARAAEVAGTPLACQWADAVAAVGAAAAAHLASTLHKAPAHDGGARAHGGSAHAQGSTGTVWVNSQQPQQQQQQTRLTLVLLHVAERHAAATAAAAAAASAATAAAAASAYAGSFRATAAAAMSTAAEASLVRANTWLGDGFAAVSAVFSPHDVSLVASLAALVHTAWERPPPRAPHHAAIDTAADAVWSRSSPPLRRYIVSACMRRALQRARPSPGGGGAAVGHQGNGMYAPGVIAAAVGALRAAGRVLIEAERIGSVPETCAELLPLLMAPLLDALQPPPLPPNPARSAVPVSVSVAAPAVRIAIYGFLRAVVAVHPSLVYPSGGCGGGSGGRGGSVAADYLRGGSGEIIPTEILSAAAGSLFEAATRAAVAEAAAASGFRGAAAAAASPPPLTVCP